ncbi:MAG: hypothetical protein OCD01_08170 [Fibrobacterales bacterium]
MIQIRVLTFKPFPAYFGSTFKGTTDVSINNQLVLRGLKLFKTGLGFHLKLPELKQDTPMSAYNFLSAGLIKEIQSQVVAAYEHHSLLGCETSPQLELV